MSKQKAQRLADAPERIWLQVCDDADCVESFAEHDGVTWCQHRIHDSDIEYVRAERIAALEAALEQARVALRDARASLHGHGYNAGIIAKVDVVLRAIEETRGC